MSRVFFLLFLALCLLPGRAAAFGDPLAARDEEGLLHQMPYLDSTDLAPRFPFRWNYYALSGQQLTGHPAYIGALQKGLYRLGYYCGPIDGAFSPAVSVAIAHLQKNHSQRVTGTITFGVRRALYLP